MFLTSLYQWCSWKPKPSKAMIIFWTECVEVNACFPSANCSSDGTLCTYLLGFTTWEDLQYYTRKSIVWVEQFYVFTERLSGIKYVETPIDAMNISSWIKISSRFLIIPFRFYILSVPAIFLFSILIFGII